MRCVATSVQKPKGCHSWYTPLTPLLVSVWQRIVQTYGLPFAPAEPPSDVPLLRRPDLLMSVHMAKPGDAFSFKAWASDASPRGDCESTAAAAAALHTVLPSTFAIARLREDPDGARLLAALSEHTPGQGTSAAALARPSRFALLLAAYEREGMRAQMANLPVALALNRTKAALVSGTAGERPSSHTPNECNASLTPGTPMVCLWTAAAYDQNGRWMLGVSLCAPPSGNEGMADVFQDDRGQMALATPHALPEVWRHHLLTQARAHETDIIWVTDGAAIAHPTKNLSDLSDRHQELIYSRSTKQKPPRSKTNLRCIVVAAHRYAPVLRTIIESLDERTTMYIADVSGKRAVHQASYAAHLTETVDARTAEERSPHILSHGPTIVKVGDGDAIPSDRPHSAVLIGDDVVRQALGRTGTAYINRSAGQASIETKENREGLHSALVDCLVGRSTSLLATFGVSLVVGGAPQGKLVCTSSCYPQPRNPPPWVYGKPGAKTWR